MPPTRKPEDDLERRRSGLAPAGTPRFGPSGTLPLGPKDTSPPQPPVRVPSAPSAGYGYGDLVRDATGALGAGAGWLANKTLDVLDIEPPKRATPSSGVVEGAVRGATGAGPAPPMPATGWSPRPVSTPPAAKQNNPDAAPAAPAPANRSFMVTSGMESRPYSEQITGLLAEPRDLSARATETGDFATGKTRTLSGIEQALARRTWLEGRQEQERGREAAEATEAAKIRYSQVDPLERARIEAGGRYGDAMIRADAEARTRATADRIFSAYLPQLAEIQNQMRQAVTPEERQQLHEQYQRLWDQALARATIALGEKPYFPADNSLAAILGSAMTAAPAAPAGVK